MLPIERRNEILSKLMLDGRVVVSDLSVLYDVTEETIRRDLDKLEKEGLAKKKKFCYTDHERGDDSEFFTSYPNV